MCTVFYNIYCIYESYTLKRFLRTLFGRQISKVFENVIDSLSDIAMYMYKDSEYQDGSISTN